MEKNKIDLIRLAANNAVLYLGMEKEKQNCLKVEDLSRFNGNMDSYRFSSSTQQGSIKSFK